MSKSLADIETSSLSDVNRLRGLKIDQFKEINLTNKTFSKEIKFGELLNEKLVGVLFNSEWCGEPGTKFLQLLNKIYVESKEKNIKFEIVFVSLDDQELSAQQAYANKHSNWHMWPFELTSIKDLISFLNVKYLPSLIILSSNFEVITSYGRKELVTRGFSAILNWEHIWKKNNKTSKQTSIILK